MTEFSVASLADTDAILDMIRERIAWMDEKGLKQWNVTDYLTCYPRTYFEESIRQGDFYLMKEDGTPVGVMALFTSDGRWDDDTNYFYVHHLTVRPGHSGGGAAMLRFAEELGREKGKRGIRLDSAVDNPALNDYYEALGYPAMSTFTEGLYEGLRRVKYLDIPLAFDRAHAADLEELWEIEAQCFPPGEMCLRANFERRMAECPEHFMLLRRTDSGEICAFVGGIRTSKPHLTDDMFAGDVCHEADGKTVMILGLNTHPAYRGRGFAAMLLRRCIENARRSGAERCVLTCHDHLIDYYASFGFCLQEDCQSHWGGENWHEMVLPLNNME